METEISKVVVYENGDILDIVKVREALFAYWQFTKAEQRAFERMKLREDLKQIFLEQTKNK